MNFTSDKGLAIFSQRNGVRGGLYTRFEQSNRFDFRGEDRIYVDITGYTDVLISSKFI